MLLVADDFDLDKADPRLGLDGRRQAPHGILQEHLNASDPALWGVVANGAKLRVLRDNASLTRPAYIEADLDLIFSEELYPDFAALWLAAHASRLEPRGGKASSCVLESWRAKAHETGERVREKLRAGVEDALRRLGGGFIEHPGNDRLRARIASGRLSTEDYHQQLLRLVYRLLFLFSAEERGALHPPDASEEARAVYREGYALSRLRERALRRRHYDKNADLWTGLKVVFQALASDGAEDLGLPALGGLFRLGQCADLDAAALENAPLLEAAHRLAFFSAGSGLSRVNYRDMDTEELGSVYESLLELYPVIDVETRPWSFSFATDAGASERKRTGSYYTPPSLVAELIKSTLEPVIEKTVKDNQTNPTEALLELKILDPACGSGHFLLAAARRVALEAARMESDSDAPEENVRRHFLREVVRRCVHGVDVNPLAVELCRTALWIEALEPGKPLSFLDAHVVQGDSLVGILDPEIMSGGIPDAAYAPLQGDDKAVCAALRKRNRQRAQRDLFDQEAADQVAVDFGEIEAMPEGTVSEINAKRAAFIAARRKTRSVREQLRADLFVGAFFAPKTRDAQDAVPLTSDIHRIDENAPARKGVRELAGRLSKEHGFFHWHLEFADVMRGIGFDVVLANPPWGRVKLQQKKFFALRRPRIALARNKAQREQMIDHLLRDGAPPADVDLYEAFVAATRNAGATSQFARASQRFPLTGRGDVNTYALFPEAALQLAAPHGRAGLIVPTGIAADHSTRDFFNHVVSKKRLASLHGFENRKRIFRNIGANSRFCLLALVGRDAPAAEAEFAYFLHDPEQLKEAERRIKLSEADFRLFNPNTRTCPMFRTRRDMEIARKMYQRAGVLWKEARGGEPEHNPWGVKFSTMFHMSNDSKLFRTRRQLEDDGWTLEGNRFVRGGEAQLPLYEAKMFHQYDHRFATFDGASEADLRKGKARLMTVDEKADSNSFLIPRYWVAETLVLDRLDKTGFSTMRAKFPAASGQRPAASGQRPAASGQRPAASGQRPATPGALGAQVTLRDMARGTDGRTGIGAMIPIHPVGHSAIVIGIHCSLLETSRELPIDARQSPCLLEPQP